MLIALCGKAGAGKDTVGGILRDFYGARLDAFAKPLKTMLASIGIQEPIREQKEMLLPGFDFSYRKAAQLLGTEWGRAVDENLWVKLAEIRANQHGQNFHPLVFTDLRFFNECQMVHSRKGCVVKVVGRESDLATNASHASEWGIPDRFVNYVIVNDGTIGQLKDKVADLAATLQLIRLT